ncbi:MAG: hypothetical protein AAB074_19455 [Planctomycetota bacterium]
MSWDLFVLKLPPGIKRLEELPDGFQAPPIGRREDIIKAILKIAPEADFSNPEWGTLEGPGFSIEISLGVKEILTDFAFHVRGADPAVLTIAKILDDLGLRALDPQSELGLFEAGPAALESLKKWREYRDRCVGNGDGS